jgi:hypothetical protein
MDPMNKNITEDTQRRRLDDAIVAVKLMFDDNLCQYYFLAFMLSCIYRMRELPIKMSVPLCRSARYIRSTERKGH